MNHIITPQNGGKQMHITDVSKEQLARVVNRQSEELRTLAYQRDLIRQLLVAILREPDGLQVLGVGRISLPMDVLLKVKQGEGFDLHRNGDRMEITLTVEEPAPAIEVPKLIVPGVN